MASRNTFLGLPGELRNQVYNMVFNDTEVLITVGKDGIDDSYRPGDALHLTCKQIHREIQGFSPPPFDTLVVKPRCAPTANDGNVVDAPLDLRAWLWAGGLLHPYSQPLQILHTYPRPVQIILHVGEIDIMQLDISNAWELDLAPIVTGIPREEVNDAMIDFGISLKITASSIKEWVLRLPVPVRSDDSHPTKGIRAVVAGAMRVPKRESSALMPAEWASLSEEEVTLLRLDMWNALHTAQERIRDALFHVYTSHSKEKYSARAHRRNH